MIIVESAIPKYFIGDKLRKVDTISEKETKRTPPKNYFLNLENQDINILLLYYPSY